MATLLTASPPALDAWGDLSLARAALARGAGHLRLEGLWGSAASLALAALLPPERPAVVAVADEPTALRVLDDLRGFAAGLGRKAPGEIVPMPVPHAALWRDAGAREEDAGRAGVLGRLLRGEPLWVIVPVRGLEAPLPRPGGLPAPGPDARPRRRGRPGRGGRAPPGRRVRAGRDRDGRGAVGAARRDRRRVLARRRPAGPPGAGRRRDRVAPDVRSDQPAVDGGAGVAARPADAARGRRRRGPLPGLPSGRRPGRGRRPGPARAGDTGGRHARGIRRSAAHRLRPLADRRGGRLPARDALDRGHARPAPPTRARPRHLARRGLPRAAPRARSADGRAAAGDPARSRARRAGRHRAPGGGASRRPGGGGPRRVRVPRARSGLPHRDRAVRSPPDHAAPADVPAGRGDRRVHGPRRRGTSSSTASTASAATRGW